MAVLLFAMALQRVTTEVVLKVTPTDVHVVRAVLGAVVFDGKVVA
ncbi:MAG: hypothetical protein ACI8UD_004250, partial [Planctomycetota bacterium]